MTEDTVLAVLDGTATEAATLVAHDHLEGCAACRRLVLLAAGSSPRRDELAWLPTAMDVPTAGPVPHVAPGTRFGRYIIQHVLGAGGAGVVYTAEDPMLARRVALKLLRSGDPELLVREGQAIARLAHPHVVAVFDLGSHDGTVFVAMELVDGASLDVWIREAPRSWRAVVDVFVQAGRGLAAAHAAGLVHRDFKPANVLVGRDGRTRVGDFGLATLARAPDGPRAIAGTPAYMAPEQLAGQAIDARADQFGFGVALHECLYGTRPFAGTTVAELRAEIARGEVAPGRASDAPAWLRRIVLRMIRPRPDDRFPDLGTALEAIQRVPARRRRRIQVAAGAATVAVVALVTTLVARRDPPSTCERTGALAGTWNPARAVAVANRATQLGVRTGAALVSRLDGYAVAWSSMAREACQAARVHGTQSEAQYERRTLCLDDRRRELAAVVELLAHGDRELLASAPLAVAALHELAPCANLTALAARVPAPANVAIAIRVDALRGRLAALRARGAAGVYREAYAGAVELAREAGATGYRPLEAEALLAAGVLARASGDAGAAELLLQRAAQAAIAGHDDVTAAAAWTARVRVLAHLARFDAAEAAAGHAAAALERLGDDPIGHAELDFHRAQLRYPQGRLDDAAAAIARGLERRAAHVAAARDPIRADMLVLRGLIEEARGEPAIARPAYAEALDIMTRELGADHVKCAAPLRGLGSVDRALGELDRAEQALRRSLALTERAAATTHPDHAVTLNFLGQLLAQRGRHAEALVAYRQALALHEQRFGADHPAVAFDLAGVGNEQAALAQLADAEASFARGRAIVERHKGDRHLDLSAFLLGEATVAEHRRRWTVAEDRLRRAISIQREALGEHHAQVASTWVELGRVLVAAGQGDRARAVYEAVLVLSVDLTRPDARAAHREAQLQLGTLLWPRQPARARALITAAHEGLEDRELRAVAARWLATHGR